MSPTHRRSTFTPRGEKLEAILVYCHRITVTLEEAATRATSEREGLELESLALLQRELETTLQRYHDDSPEMVRATFAQYTLELDEPGDSDAPLAWRSEEVVAWAFAGNATLETVFRQLADSAETPLIEEAYRKCAELVAGHRRHMAFAEDTAGDL